MSNWGRVATVVAYVAAFWFGTLFSLQDGLAVFWS